MAAHPQAVTSELHIRRPVWKALETHYKRVRDLHLRDLFANDPTRGERMVAQGAGIYLDYSKNRITDHTLKLLTQLAEESGLQARIDAMFRGEKINNTEKRAVLHVALRAPRGASIFVDGENVVPRVHAVLDKMSHFCARVRSGDWKGHTGKPIRNVINIGIGGSDLGPVMAYEALKYYSDRSINFRFVSNVDGSDFVEAVRDLDAVRNPVHRFLENLHHAGNDDQCPCRPCLASRRFGRRRELGVQALCGSLNQCGRSSEVRH